MTYTQLKRAFDSRAKGRDYKVFYYGDYARLTMDSDNALIVHTSQWHYPENERPYRSYIPVMRITEDDVVEVIDDKFGDSITERNVMMKVVPLVWVTSDTSRFGSHTHTLRVRSRSGNVPLTKGLKLNIKTGEILWHAPDTKRQTNRAAAAPVYDFVTKAKRMAEVLCRLGEFEGRERRNWGDQYLIAKTVDKLPLEEQHIAEFATAMYLEASARVSWDNRTPEGILALGERRLREALKKKAGAFDLVAA